MLRALVPRSRSIAALTLAATTAPQCAPPSVAPASTSSQLVSASRGYKYQEFEYSKQAQLLFYYPREAPNTSYFPQWQLGFWIWFGYGREENWIDRDERRYQTTWQYFKKILIFYIPAFYIFPFGIPGLWAKEVYGEYGEKSFMQNKHPFDNNYVEMGGNTLDPEWQRHIHTRDSF